MDNFVGASLREECLWEICENAVNKFLRKMMIVGRTDELSIALDDNKIWLESSGRNSADDFGIQKVTHVKDNRKGIISRTAASLTTIMSLTPIQTGHLLRYNRTKYGLVMITGPTKKGYNWTNRFLKITVFHSQFVGAIVA